MIIVLENIESWDETIAVISLADAVSKKLYCLKNATKKLLH